jgi:hypothetical protein
MTPHHTLLIPIYSHTAGASRDFHSRLLRALDLRVLPIEDNRHLFQGVATCLWVEEVCCEAETGQHGDEDEVVFPADGFEGDGVDECVEELF